MFSIVFVGGDELFLWEYLGAVSTDGGRCDRRSGSAWDQLGQDIDGEAAGDRSGFSVSLAGNRLAIGAYQNDGNGSNSGHVRIYEWSGSAWDQLARY